MPYAGDDWVALTALKTSGRSMRRAPFHFALHPYRYAGGRRRRTSYALRGQVLPLPATVGALSVGSVGNGLFITSSAPGQSASTSNNANSGAANAAPTPIPGNGTTSNSGTNTGGSYNLPEPTP
jgi:hypothetical protein